MARFRMTNHLLHPTDRAHSSKISSEMGAFQRIISGLVRCHEGADHQALEKATTERLCSMPVGKTEVYRHPRFYHLSVKRLPDEPIFCTDLNTSPEMLPALRDEVKKYLSTFPAKRLIDYNCPACKAALQLVGPPKHDTWDSLTSCYECGQAFHYRISHGDRLPLITFREQEDFQ